MSLLYFKYNYCIFLIFLTNSFSFIHFIYFTFFLSYFLAHSCEYYSLNFSDFFFSVHSKVLISSGVNICIGAYFLAVFLIDFQCLRILVYSLISRGLFSFVFFFIFRCILFSSLYIYMQLIFPISFTVISVYLSPE